MRPCPARHQREPAPWDCRQTDPRLIRLRGFHRRAWVIIGRLVSLLGTGLAGRGRALCKRLAATSLALWVIAIASLVAVADALPDSTWVATGSLPHQGRTAIFALAVDPSNNQV